MKKKRERKKGSGRKPKSGVLSGIRPERDTWTDIRNRIIYDSAEWPLVGLCQLIGDGSKLPDNYLSARATENAEIARRQKPQGRHVLLDKIDALWNKLSAQFERAVLDGDADWFKRQANALGSVQQQEKIRFNAKVVHLLEQSMWGTRAKQRRTAGDQRRSKANTQLRKLIERRKAEQAGMTEEQIVTRKRKPYDVSEGAEQDHKQRENAASVRRAAHCNRDEDDSTLTPAGKFTDAMASDIYNALKQEEKDGVLYVEDCKFESKERAMEAIHGIAELLQFALKKQPRRKRRKQ